MRFGSLILTIGTVVLVYSNFYTVVKKCSTCKIDLTAVTASPCYVRAGGYCRSCQNNRCAYFRKSHPLWEEEMRREANEQKREQRGWRSLDDRKMEAAPLRFLRLLPLLTQAVKEEELRFNQHLTCLFKGPFWGLVFQPRICVDCNHYFETCYPDGGGRGTGTRRCYECRRFFRLKNHGGGPRRRCKHFGVPYQAFNPRKVFEDDNWQCRICLKFTTPEHLGTRFDDAPEIDHIWPLSVVYDGRKSPGHVPSNCRTACRKCNSIRGNAFYPTDDFKSVAEIDEFMVHRDHVKNDVPNTPGPTEVDFTHRPDEAPRRFGYSPTG